MNSDVYYAAWLVFTVAGVILTHIYCFRGKAHD